MKTTTNDANETNMWKPHDDHDDVSEELGSEEEEVKLSKAGRKYFKSWMFLSFVVILKVF